jgi:SAM-dependent methyltransferase
MATDTTYTPGFYEQIDPGCKSSAEVIVPLLIDAFHPKSVIDVGCGTGRFAEAFAKRGVATFGVDGEYARPYATDKLGAAFEAVDLAQPGSLSRFALDDDMAVCLEVAEHLPPERAESFVAELCALAPVVVFSAAIPGQSGAGHINCQWQSWWARAFIEDNGRKPLDIIRPRVWLDLDEVEPWYAQNLLVYIAAGEPWTYEQAAQERWGLLLDIVHPTIWGWKS